jgi:hypothetical protein
LYRALDRKYIAEDEFEHLYSEAATIGSQIGAMMVYLRNSNLRGAKYHEPTSPYSATNNPKPGTRNPKPGTISSTFES